MNKIKISVEELRFYVPQRLLDFYEKKYPQTKENLNRAVNSWLLQDFSYVLSNTEKPTGKETYIAKKLVQKRFFRLFPLIYTMEFLTTEEIVSLWAIEHIEEDLHKKNKYLSLAKPHMSPTDEIELMQACGYISKNDLIEGILSERFTTE